MSDMKRVVLVEEFAEKSDDVLLFYKRPVEVPGIIAQHHEEYEKEQDDEIEEEEEIFGNNFPEDQSQANNSISCR